MLRKLKELCLTLGVFGLVAVPIAVPVTVYADNQILASVCNGQDVATDSSAAIDVTGKANTGNCSGETGTGGVQKLLKLVINVFSLIVGFVAVIMIIYGGVKYITSGGDSNNISGAKNTIIYAIIGLVIVALAQVIVRFVLAKSLTVTTG